MDHASIAPPAASSYLRGVTEADEKLEIHVNGELRRARIGCSVAEMLGELGINPLRVAVERNREIIPRARLGDARVEAGDTYEIVHFVGGG